MQEPQKRRRCGATGFVLVTSLVMVVSLLLMSRETQAGWSTLETEHFRIHFETQHASLANAVAWRVELVHHELVPRIGHIPSAKTHVIISDTSDAANAFASPVFENRMVIYPVFPSLSMGYLAGFDFGFDDWLTLLIMHEYAHILHMDMQSPSSKAITSILGRVPYLSTPILLAPPMLLEGYAVYHESRTGGGRGNSSYYAMYLRTAALADRLPEFDQVIGEYPSERWQPGGHVYLYGYSFLSYLVNQFGEHVLDRMNTYLMRRPDAFGRAIADTTGRSLQVLWADWQAESSANAKSEAQHIAEEPLTTLEVIETVGHHVLFPTPAPDQSAMAYIALGGTVPALRLLDPATQRERELAPIQGLLTTEIAWHRDGKHLVVAALRDNGGNLATQLIEVNVHSGATKALADTWRAFAPAYDPSGDRLAYIRRSELQTELRVRDLRTGNDQVLLADPDLTLLSLTWSPTGQQLALSVWSTENGAHIALYDLHSAQLIPLAGGGGTYQSPAWTPDASKILFSADRTGVFNLYAYDLERQEVTRLTNTLTGLFFPRSVGDGTLTAMYYTAEGYRLVRVLPDLHTYTPEPAWIRESTVDQATAEEAHAVQIYNVVPYSPWPSLQPKYWLPSVQEMAGETHVGAATAGQDILGNTAYSGYAALGMGSGRLTYSLNVEQAMGAGHKWSVYGGISDVPLMRSRPSGLQWYEVQELSLGTRWRGTLARGQHIMWLQASRALERAYRSVDDPLSISRLEGGWEIALAGGAFDVRSGHFWRLRAAVDPANVADWLFVLEHVDEYRLGSGEAVRLAFNLGLTGKPDRLWLGGSFSEFSLRGYRGRRWGGDMLMRVNVEGRLPLRRVERGYHDTPMFLKDIALHPFVEVGYVTVRGTEAKQLTLALGAELGLDTYLGYGAAPTDWRIGVSYGRGEPGPQLYLRIASRF